MNDKNKTTVSPSRPLIGYARFWHRSHRFDKRVLPLADAHYSRQKPGTSQFVTPGSCIVLRTQKSEALWVTSFPKYAKHDWQGAWNCAMFRNESEHLSSAMITEAVAITREIYKVIPPLGMITFVDPTKVRKKRDFGRCFLKAGFVRVGETKSGKIVLQLFPEKMPQPIQPFGFQPSLFSERA